MKAKLNLSIEDNILSDMKVYASRHKKSISLLVEGYFKSITRKSRKKNILDIIDKMDKPGLETNDNLKELFYTTQSKKYGF